MTYYRFFLAFMFFAIVLLAAVQKNATLNLHQLDIPIGERN